MPMVLISVCAIAFGLRCKAPFERDIAAELRKSQPNIHPDAIPILLKWLEEWNPQKENFLESKLSASTYRTIFGSTPRERGYLATKGFETLGASADSAIPELVKLLGHQSSHNFAAESLCCLGPYGIQALLERTSSSDEVVTTAFLALGNGPVATNSEVVSALIRGLKVESPTTKAICAGGLAKAEIRIDEIIRELSAASSARETDVSSTAMQSIQILRKRRLMHGN